MNPIIIVGSGIAGYTLVKKLRSLESKRPLILLTLDKGDYYYKPVLSNAYANNLKLKDLILSPGNKMAKQYSFELWDECKAEKIDPLHNKLHTSRGVIKYDNLVLACGSLSRKLSCFPPACKDIISVNHLEDYRKLREALKNKKSITILGSGLVGCEFANDLAQAGFDVSVVSIDKYPLENYLPNTSGISLKEKFSSLGIKWHLDAHITSIFQHQNGLLVNLKNGKNLETELILSAIGFEANTGLAKVSGIKINGGIVVDNYLRTNHSNIFTLGDCAVIKGRLWPFVSSIRFESEALAKTLTGNPTPLSCLPFKVAVKTPAYPLSLNIEM